MKHYILLLSVFITTTLFGEVSFTASAPGSIPVGQPFQLVYSVNASAKDLKVPDISTGFEIIAGPFSSQSHSTQFINGQRTSSTTLSYTYTLIAQKEGTYNIPAATISVSGQQYKSNGLSIKVLPADKVESDNNSSNNGSNSQKVQTSQQITNENLFIRALASKSKIREQECILLTYKIYSRVDLIDIQQPKFPELKGFLVQEIELPTNQQLSLENYNDKNYNTYVIKQYLLFPQKSGAMEIEELTCNAVVRVRQQITGGRSIFDDFFDSFQEVRKPLKSNSIKLNVSALPTPKPANFSGAVGDFNIKSTISKTEVNANEAITIKVTISGKGNLKMIPTPTIEFPHDFETYEPKVTNQFENTKSGAQGTKTIEYLAIPRHGGNFTIPSIDFNYFNSNSDSYKTISTESYKITVAKGSGSNSESSTNVSNYTSQEMVKTIATDIRYIIIEDVVNVPYRNIYNTTLHWLLTIIPLLISLGLIIIFRKQAKENADIALSKNKRANKVARKRLKSAAISLKEKNNSKFFQDILNALWGYTSDKLALPQAQLNRENVKELLINKNVPEENINEFLSLLDKCEFYQYAPNQTAEEIEKIYENTSILISKLENIIKR